MSSPTVIEALAVKCMSRGTILFRDWTADLDDLHNFGLEISKSLKTIYPWTNAGRESSSCAEGRKDWKGTLPGP